MKGLFVGMVAIAVVACGDSGGPGKQAASVTGVAGDSQVAPTGATFAFPLSLVALGSDGVPIQGVSVNWTVTPAGGALFNPQSTQTDADGIASTSVRAGTDTGEIVIHANVSGVAPVNYHALVLDPCAFAGSYNIGDTATGVLATTDCNLGNRGWYYDFFAFATPPAQQSLRIKMKSSAFDPFVDLYNTAGELVAFDDDSILGVPPNNSQLDVILPGDTYLIGANSFDPGAVGPYSVSAQPRQAAMNGCRQVWVARGVTVSDSITNTTLDCADSSATPKHYDVARIIVYSGTSGTVLTIAARSAAINPMLALYQLNLNTYARTLVASNDDSAATTTDAVIAYSVTAPSAYDIIITTSTVGETGAYTFEVSPLLTSPPASKSVITGREFWRGRSLLPKRAALPKP